MKRKVPTSFYDVQEHRNESVFEEINSMLIFF